MESNKKPLKWAPLGSIKSVAWMVIVGDALHNFVDGLGIGAAFSENTLTGISLSLAILCEELPHELGIFPIIHSNYKVTAECIMEVRFFDNHLAGC